MDKFPGVVAGSGEEGKVRKSLDVTRRSEAKFVPGERRKNELDLKMVELIHTMHEALFSRFSLGGVPTFYDEQIHLVDPGVYAQSLPLTAGKEFLSHIKKSPAGYMFNFDQIFVWETKDMTHEQRFVYLLHETLHLISYQVVTASHEKKTLKVTEMGIGNRESFGLIDEGIIQSIVQVMCSEYEEELRSIGLSVEEVKKTSFSARREEVRALRENIVPVLATSLGLSEEEVFLRGIRSFFTGSSDFLDMCRAVWGDAGVDILALSDIDQRPVYTRAALQCLRLPREEVFGCANKLDKAT